MALDAHLGSSLPHMSLTLFLSISIPDVLAAGYGNPLKLPLQNYELLREKVVFEVHGGPPATACRVFGLPSKMASFPTILLQTFWGNHLNHNLVHTDM